MSVCMLSGGETRLNENVIDYKALFEKYVKMVLDCEGKIYDWTPSRAIVFTEAEKNELKRVEWEYDNE